MLHFSLIGSLQGYLCILHSHNVNIHSGNSSKAANTTYQESLFVYYFRFFFFNPAFPRPQGHAQMVCLSFQIAALFDPIKWNLRKIRIRLQGKTASISGRVVLKQQQGKGAIKKPFRILLIG